MISPGTKILVGFSGGPDSVSLLSFLSANYGNVSAVHVNHMLRGDDAYRDESFCRQFCERRGIEFFCERTDIKALSNGVSVEETARDERYRIYKKFASEHGFTAVALAHTASDNAETVIFNMARGCGLSGICGIPPVRKLCDGVSIIRPLIFCLRSDIMDYVSENGLSYVTDATNTDTEYTRNYIRGVIIPELLHVNSGAVNAIASLSESARRDAEFAEAVSHTFFSENYADGIRVDKLIAQPKAIISRVISEMFSLHCDKALESAHYDAVIGLLEKKNGKTALPGDMYAETRGGILRIYAKSDYLKASVRGEYSYPLTEGLNEFDEGFVLYISPRPDKNIIKELKEKYSFSACAPLSYIPSSPCAVSRKNSDSYRYYGMTRSVKKLLAGAPIKAVKTRPVIRDGEDILFFPGYPVCDGARTEKSAVPCEYIYYFE